jgi:hypothetical protein
MAMTTTEVQTTQAQDLVRSCLATAEELHIQFGVREFFNEVRLGKVMGLPNASGKKVFDAFCVIALNSAPGRPRDRVARLDVLLERLVITRWRIDCANLLCRYEPRMILPYAAGSGIVSEPLPFIPREVASCRTWYACAWEKLVPSPHGPWIHRVWHWTMGLIIFEHMSHRFSEWFK